MNTQEATQKIRQLKELQALIDEAEQEAERIKNELKAYMTAQGTQEMNIDIYKLRYKTVKGSHFDTAAFRKTHEELYTQYCKPTISMRFCVM